MENLVINEFIFKRISEILSSREQYIVFRRSGLGGRIPSLTELRLELNMSYEDIKKLENNANKKIKKCINLLPTVNQNNQMFDSVIINKDGLLRIVQTKKQREDEIKKIYQKLEK